MSDSFLEKYEDMIASALYNIAECSHRIGTTDNCTGDKLIEINISEVEEITSAECLVDGYKATHIGEIDGRLIVIGEDSQFYSAHCLPEVIIFAIADTHAISA